MGKTVRVNPTTFEDSRDGVRRSGNKRKLIAQMKDKERRRERKRLERNESEFQKD